MSEPTFSEPPRALPAGSPDADAWTIGADADAPIRFLPPNTNAAQLTLMEILQSGSLPPTEYDGPVATGTVYEILDAEGRTVRVGTILNGDFTIYRNGEEVGRMSSHNARQVDSLSPLILSEPNYTFTTTIYRTGSGDGRGGNARDRRKARRAGRLWRSLGDVVRGADDAPDAAEWATTFMGEMTRAIWSGDALDLRKWTVLPGGEWKVTP